MERNVGGFDLFRRVVVGVLFGAVGLTILFESVVVAVTILVGGYLLITAILRRCTINARRGYDTSAGS